MTTLLNYEDWFKQYTGQNAKDVKFDCILECCLYSAKYLCYLEGKHK